MLHKRFCRDFFLSVLGFVETFAVCINCVRHVRPFSRVMLCDILSLIAIATELVNYIVIVASVGYLNSVCVSTVHSDFNVILSF